MNIIIFFGVQKKKKNQRKKENKEEKSQAHDWAFSFFFWLQSKKNRASCLSQSRKYSHPPMLEPATSSLSRKLTD